MSLSIEDLGCQVVGRSTDGPGTQKQNSVLSGHCLYWMTFGGGTNPHTPVVRNKFLKAYKMKERNSIVCGVDRASVH